MRDRGWARGCWPCWRWAYWILALVFGEYVVEGLGPTPAWRGLVSTLGLGYFYMQIRPTW